MFCNEWNMINHTRGKDRGMKNMAERELKRLKRRELLQMLIIQCEETERMQKETDEMRAKMSEIMESYERLKKKLDVKDERLDQKDAKIAELNLEIEKIKMSAFYRKTGASSAGRVVPMFGQTGRPERNTASGEI